MFDIIVRTLLFILSAAGIGLCLIWGLPSLQKYCIGDCKALSETGASHIFGFPNWQAGAAYYSVSALSAIFAVWPLVLAASAGAVIALFVSMLLFALLITRYRVNCTICYAAYGVNLAIFLVWIAIALQGM